MMINSARQTKEGDKNKSFIDDSSPKSEYFLYVEAQENQSILDWCGLIHGVVATATVASAFY